MRRRLSQPPDPPPRSVGARQGGPERAQKPDGPAGLHLPPDGVTPLQEADCRSTRGYTGVSLTWIAALLNDTRCPVSQKAIAPA